MSTTVPQNKKGAGRRDFLRGIGMSAGVTLAAVAGPMTAAAITDDKNRHNERKTRYRADSPEVKTYYRVNRYPSK